MHRVPAEQQRDVSAASHVLVITDKGAYVFAGSAEPAFAKFALDEILHRTRQGDSQSRFIHGYRSINEANTTCDQM